MTDRTTITLDADHDLMVAPHDAGIRLSLLPVRETPAHISITVATSALLAAIDAADPDAMRAYLRETLMHEDRENLRAYLEPEQLDAIPEADSPEDLPKTMIRQFGRAEALLASGNHLIAQASELLDSLAEELDR